MGWTGGLPSEGRLYSYHPDEITMVRHGLWVASGVLNPHFFRYGSLFIYICGALFLLRELFGPLSSAGAHLIVRGASLCFGMGQVWVAYLLGRELYGRRAGLCAAALLAVTPLAVLSAHWGTVDNCAAFFFVCSAYYAARLLRSERTRDYALAGAFAGLSAATKYYGVVALILVLAAHVRRVGFRPRDVFSESALAAPLAAGAAFVAGCPYAVLAFDEFRRDFALELAHKAQGGTVYLEGLPGWVFFGARALPAALGHALLAALVICVVWLVVRRRAQDVALVGWLALLYAMGGSGREIFVRYAIPMLPFVALAVGALVEGEKAERANAKEPRSSPRRQAAGWAVAGAAFLYTALCAVAYVGILGREDTRDIALREIRARLEPGEGLGLMRPVWFYSPPVIRENGGPHSGEKAMWAEAERAGVKLCIVGRDWRYLFHARPKLFVFSDIEQRMELAAHESELREFLAKLGERYELAAVCRSEPRLGPLVFPDAHVHDWRYINPEIYIYARKSEGEE